MLSKLENIFLKLDYKHKAKERNLSRAKIQ